MKSLHLIVLLLCVFPILGTVREVNLMLPSNPALNQYHTIIEAYNAAANGDVIRIHPGDYYLSQPSELISGAKTLMIMGTTINSSRLIANNQPILNLTGGVLTVSNLTFMSTGGSGIYLQGGNPVLNVRNCFFDTCDTGVYANTSSTIFIDASVFRNSVNGIYIYSGLSGATVQGKIRNNVFHNNTIGIKLNNAETTCYTDIVNSIFLNNTDYSIRKTYASYYGVVGYNNFYGNGNSNNVSGVALGTGNITTQSPLLGNTTGSPYYNYFLATNSPCIDAGNPDSNYSDLDNTRNDMGVFGGQYALGNGKPIVLNIEVSPDPVQQGGTITIQATGQMK